MSDPSTARNNITDITQHQYANPLRESEYGYEIEQLHCIYLGNNRFWCSETKEERIMRDEFSHVFEGLYIGSCFVYEIKTKPGTQITAIRPYNP